MRVAYLSPLPPTRSGVAHYSSMLLPALQKRVDVKAFGSLEDYWAPDFDLAIYQLGNNPHHEFVYAEAMRTPGIAVLHDLVLHHLIVEMTLARGDAEGYVEALRANHGEAGAAWARGRAAGLHSEMGNFLLPASVDVAQRSRAVIVHNDWAAARLREFGVTTPIFIAPHPHEPQTRTPDRDAVRARLGIAPTDRVVGVFGFLTSAKRAEVIVEAFRRARERHPNLRLLIAGEPAPNIDMAAIAGEGVIMTGYVADEDFASYYAAADRLVNLRYPSAGETSGTLVRAFVAGKPVAVSNYAQFSEFPPECVVHIPLGDAEVEALADFFVRDVNMAAIARAQQIWLGANATSDGTVNVYLDAIEATPGHTAGVPLQPPAMPAIPLFPHLALSGIAFHDDMATLSLRNDGRDVIRARVYGEPGYRVIAKLFGDGGEISSQWLDISADLHAGDAAEIDVRVPRDARLLRLYHALQGLPVVDPSHFAEVGIRRV